MSKPIRRLAPAGRPSPATRGTRARPSVPAGLVADVVHDVQDLLTAALLELGFVAGHIAGRGEPDADDPTAAAGAAAAPGAACDFTAACESVRDAGRRLAGLGAAAAAARSVVGVGDARVYPIRRRPGGGPPG